MQNEMSGQHEDLVADTQAADSSSQWSDPSAISAGAGRDKGGSHDAVGVVARLGLVYIGRCSIGAGALPGLAPTDVAAFEVILQSAKDCKFILDTLTVT